MKMTREWKEAPVGSMYETDRLCKSLMGSLCCAAQPPCMYGSVSISLVSPFDVHTSAMIEHSYKLSLVAVRVTAPPALVCSAISFSPTLLISCGHSFLPSFVCSN